MNKNIVETNKLNISEIMNKPNTVIKEFINELQDYLDKIHSSKLLSTLPQHTILTFAKFDKSFAMCFDYNEKKIYYVPKEKIVGNLPKPGEALKFYSEDKFYVDTTAILAEENKINTYLKECNIAK